LGTDWFADAIIYQVFIDRFSRGLSRDGSTPSCEGAVFCGGTIDGIVERLQYLVDLGINTVWITPFNTTAAYHGYHVTDFFAVDPHFGTEQSVQQLIERCHKLGLWLLMDFVANHVHRTHPFFIAALQNPASKYRDWFNFTGPGSYLSFLDFDELPKLNLDNPDARAHVIEAALFWLDRGFDGFRLDHVIGPRLNFWRRFAREVKAKHHDAVLIGEASLAGVDWSHLKTIDLRHKRLLLLLAKLGMDPSDLVMHQYVGILDGTLDFTFQSLMRRFIAERHWYLPRRLLPLMLRRHYRMFPKGFYLPSFLDNHDMSRFLFQAGQDVSRFKEAARIQFVQSQPPVIYYGTEVGMTQDQPTSGGRPYSDLEARQLMPWDPRHQNLELLKFYQDIISDRRRRNAENGR